MLNMKGFEEILGAIAIVIGLYFVFSNDWIEYECDEYKTGIKVELYKKGGVIEKYADGKSISWELEIIDGDKFRSYIEEPFEYKYKLNFDDLTYRYRYLFEDFGRDEWIQDTRRGQCRKVGFFASLIHKPYSFN